MLTRPSIDQFASTDTGEAFHRAYDAVLAKWPDGTVPMALESDYGTTHINACGPQDGAPVILLPGGGATSTVWFGNVSALSAHNRVYAVDLIGEAGRSIPRGKPVKTIDELLD